MEETVATWNPWWNGKGVPTELRGRPRRATARIREDLPAPEVLAITGLRRVGKTTILYQLIDHLISQGVPPANILFLNLEDPSLDGLPLDELIEARPRPTEGRRYVFLDEVQARDEWERWIRARYDRREPIKFVVSGSSSDLTRGEYARLLTGRTFTRVIRPLSFTEFLEFSHDWTKKPQDSYPPSPPALPPTTLPEPPQEAPGDDAYMLSERYLKEGGFPRAARERWYHARDILQQYFEDILYRDLIMRRGCDPERIHRLAVYIAEAFARTHTRRALARATGVSEPTALNYLDALESAYLIRRVHRYVESPKPSREDASPFKVYWTDVGLRNSVVRNPNMDAGRRAENVVAMTLDALHGRPFYWTDGKGRYEVDFVVVRSDGTMDATQVWYGGLLKEGKNTGLDAEGVLRPSSGGRPWRLDDVPDREWNGLRAFADAYPRRLGSLTLVTSGLEGRLGNIIVRPLDKWLVENQTPGPMR